MVSVNREFDGHKRLEKQYFWKNTLFESTHRWLGRPMDYNGAFGPVSGMLASTFASTHIGLHASMHGLFMSMHRCFKFPSPMFANVTPLSTPQL